MTQRIPPPMGQKAVRRLQRRNAFIQRYRDLAGEEWEDSTGPRHFEASSFKKGKQCRGRTKKLFSDSEDSEDSDGEEVSFVIEERNKPTHSTNRDALRSKSPRKRIQSDKHRHQSGTGDLTKEENETLTKSFRLSDENVVVYLPESNIHLRASSFRKLQENNWLDDEIVNGFAGMINARNRYIRTKLSKRGYHHIPPDIPHTHMVSSFLFTKISKDKQSLTERGVLGWTSKAKLDVLTYELILVPLHVSGNHWALCCIDLVYKEFTYIDSLYSSDRNNAISALKIWLHEEIKAKKGEPTAEKYNIPGWTERVNIYRAKTVRANPCRSAESFAGRDRHGFKIIPKQTDNSSCGVFMVKFADCLSKGIPIMFTQKDVGVLRKKIGLEFIQGYLTI